MHNYCTPHIIKENYENFLIHRCNYILLYKVYCVWQVVKTPTIISNNPVYLDDGLDITCISSVSTYIYLSSLTSFMPLKEYNPCSLWQAVTWNKFIVWAGSSVPFFFFCRKFFIRLQIVLKCFRVFYYWKFALKSGLCLKQQVRLFVNSRIFGYVLSSFIVPEEKQGENI